MLFYPNLEHLTGAHAVDITAVFEELHTPFLPGKPGNHSCLNGRKVGYIKELSLWRNKGWCGDRANELKVTDTVNLAYNGSRFVRENIAVMLTYKGLVDTSPGNGLVWIPLYPELSTPTYLIWQKFQVFTPIVEKFLEHLIRAFKKLNQVIPNND